jgi:hypothetical protein
MREDKKRAAREALLPRRTKSILMQSSRNPPQNNRGLPGCVCCQEVGWTSEMSGVQELVSEEAFSRFNGFRTAGKETCSVGSILFSASSRVGMMW